VTAEHVATPFQTVGPFFHIGLMPSTLVGPRASDQASAFSFVVSVKDGEGVAVPDAWIEVWESDADSPSEVGRQATDTNGGCAFDVARACAHLNVCVFARGLLRYVATRAYFGAADDLVDDPVLALVPPDRRATLLARPDGKDSRRWRFDIRLQGDGETVFFDM
jgi:protocatechuate 3,4-dioxygenase alpha subunit